MRKHSWIWPFCLLVALLGASALGNGLPLLDRIGSYLMVAAAVALLGIILMRRK